MSEWGEQHEIAMTATIGAILDALWERGASAGREGDDILVEWHLSELMEFCQEWRSEIEELG